MRSLCQLVPLSCSNMHSCGAGAPHAHHEQLERGAQLLEGGLLQLRHKLLQRLESSMLAMDIASLWTVAEGQWQVFALRELAAGVRQQHDSAARATPSNPCSASRPAALACVSAVRWLAEPTTTSPGADRSTSAACSRCASLPGRCT